MPYIVHYDLDIGKGFSRSSACEAWHPVVPPCKSIADFMSAAVMMLWPDAASLLNFPLIWAILASQ